MCLFRYSACICWFFLNDNVELNVYCTLDMKCFFDNKKALISDVCDMFCYLLTTRIFS